MHLRAVPDADETSEADDDVGQATSSSSNGAEGRPGWSCLAEARTSHVHHTGSDRKVVEQLSVASFAIQAVVTVDAKRLEVGVEDGPRRHAVGGAEVDRFGSEKQLLDATANENSVMNENVLIEIGGAMALWGDNFVLLVEEARSCPATSTGPRVRYRGDVLDHEATMKLLRAFKEFKSQTTAGRGGGPVGKLKRAKLAQSSGWNVPPCVPTSSIRPCTEPA